MWMLITGVNFEFTKHGSTKFVLRHHTLNGSFDGTLRRFIDKLLKGDGFYATWVAGMMVIVLVGRFVTRDLYLFSIDDNDVVAGINVRGVFRLMLAT